MRKIIKTIDEGGFLTDRFFIPRHIWFQGRAKIPDIEKKLHFYDEINKELKSIFLVKKQGGDVRKE